MNIAAVLLMILAGLASAKDTTDIQALKTQIEDTGKFKQFVEGSKTGSGQAAEPPIGASSRQWPRQGRLKPAEPIAEARSRLDRISVPSAAKQGLDSDHGLTSIGQVALAMGLGTALLLVVAGNLSDSRPRPKIKLKEHDEDPPVGPQKGGFQPDLEPLVSDPGDDV